MTKLKLLSALLLGSTLVACGGGSSGGGTSSISSSSSSSECPLLGCPTEDPATELDITNEPLPLIERFDTGSTGENRAVFFFSENYKSLNSENPQTLPGGTVHFDEEHSFYYPTCCLWETDPITGERTGNTIPDLDERQFVGQGFMAVSGARFSIGQLLPDIVSAEASDDNDAKSKTSQTPAASSWGELDLSVPYRVSYCLKDAGRAGSGTGGNLELYVDNNSGGNQDHSLHGNQSMLLRTAVTGLTPGNRMVIDVPGQVRQVNASGETVGNVLAVISETFGTENSYLQFRVSSGGYAVISDLVVEHQGDGASYVGYEPCVADSTLFTPPAIEGVAFTGLPLTVNVNASKDDFFGDNQSAAFLAFPDDLTTAFYAGLSGKGRVLLEGTHIRFGNARWSVGFRGTHTNATGYTVEDLNGGLDLSEPYRIVLNIAALTTTAPASADFHVYVDNSSGNADGTPHGGTASRIFTSKHSALATGELVINVPGEVTLNGAVIGSVAEHMGTAKSFIQFHCPGNCGNAEAGNTLGISLSGIKIEKQNEIPPFIEEDFSAADAETFLSAAYKSVPNDETKPLYEMTAGSATFADGAMTLSNARFTVGSLDNSVLTTSADTSANGALDLSRPYRLRFNIVSFESTEGAASPGEFHVYVDNNTTSTGNSMHGGNSRVIRQAVGSITVPGEVVVSPTIGTETSFLQIRADSRAIVVIDNFTIEYLD